MLFKAAVCLMAVVIMMFSTVSALAAVDYYTTTTYNLSTGEVTVKTTVTNVTANDEIAYIAYTGGNPETDGAIFYIDQKTADEGNNVFEYTADATKIADDTHVMLVGTANNGKLSDDQTSAIKFGTDYTLTVVVTGGKVALADAADATNKTEVENKTATIKVGNGNEIIYQLTAAEGYDDTNPVVALVDAQGVAIAHENKTFEVTGDATLTVTFAQTETETEIVKEIEVNASEKNKTTTSYVNNNTQEEVRAEAITKFGTMTIGSTQCDAYGIELSDTADFADKSVFKGTGSWTELTAADGRFAIVIEGLEGEFNGDYYIRTFVTVGGKTTYGETFKYVDGVGDIYTASAAN